MVQFSKGPLKIQKFIYRFLKKMAAICPDFEMVGIPDLRTHSKFKPFANQPLSDHLKSRHVLISYPHCKFQ